MQRLAVVLVLLFPLVGAREAPAEDAAPTVQEVHAAIRRGASFLEAEHASGFEDRRYHDPVELVVLTLHHAGLNLQNETYRQGVEAMEAAKPRFTYRVSVQAMALAELNPRKYRARLAHCAQWLVDTQLAGGEWGYPGTIDGPGRQPYPAAVKAPEGTTIRRSEERPTFEGEKGDFSNTQFAILGLRACRDAGIEIPKATWKDALAYLKEYQRPDGGWGYVYSGEQDGASYASLTCAGLCSTAICLHALGKRPGTHPMVEKGLAWLEKHWSPEENVGIEKSTMLGPSSWQLYHLYSLERAARVLGLEAVGDRAWYPSGARTLLRTQRADGSWADPRRGFGRPARYLTVADTCFAILFLARATPPLTR